MATRQPRKNEEILIDYGEQYITRMAIITRRIMLQHKPILKTILPTSNQS